MNENENLTTDETTDAPISADGQDTPDETQDYPVDDFLNNPAIVEYINAQIQEGIKKALKGKPPKANTTDATEQEVKSFDKMTYKERLNLFKSNPQKYQQLAKGVK
jgi:hypothetical protein